MGSAHSRLAADSLHVDDRHPILERDYNNVSEYFNDPSCQKVLCSCKARLLNDSGRQVSNGRLELTYSDLIYRYPEQNVPKTASWPLCGLRGFGGGEHLFTFEAGPGIFVFKCKRALSLNSILSEHVARLAQMERSCVNSCSCRNHNGWRTIRSIGEASHEPSAIIGYAEPIKGLRCKSVLMLTGGGMSGPTVAVLLLALVANIERISDLDTYVPDIYLLFNQSVETVLRRYCYNDHSTEVHHVHTHRCQDPTPAPPYSATTQTIFDWPTTAIPSNRIGASGSSQRYRWRFSDDYIYLSRTLPSPSPSDLHNHQNPGISSSVTSLPASLSGGVYLVAIPNFPSAHSYENQRTLFTAAASS
ncbi:hypothetical protein ACTXT7_001406 [Hymenolepis weldensis]